jgi:hypothetical protein
MLYVSISVVLDGIVCIYRKKVDNMLMVDGLIYLDT